MKPQITNKNNGQEIKRRETSLKPPLVSCLSTGICGSSLEK